MKYTRDETRRRKRERETTTTTVLNIGRARKEKPTARVSAQEPAPPGTNMVVLRVPGQRNVCEKHIADVPAAANFLRVGRGHRARRERRAFYLFISRLRQPPPSLFFSCLSLSLFLFGKCRGVSSIGARWEPTSRYRLLLVRATRQHGGTRNDDDSGDECSSFLLSRRGKKTFRGATRRFAIGGRDFSNSLTANADTTRYSRECSRCEGHASVEIYLAFYAGN